ncbi:MAG: quinone-dependent dihydroorotate dehydrogenase [Rhizobiales bacterium]|nr:quinone-dependent dihydroorotate dehydrogenase [Hyphomicrobiales bacterium]
MTDLWPLARPFLFGLDPERAHRLALQALKTGLVPRPPQPEPSLRRRLLGLDFANPLGMAAGFDKHAEVPDGLLALGFGFVEIGTVTPRPQPGNPRPRLFRLPEHEALINRFGFNSEGHDAAHARLVRRARRGILGVNVGANKDSADRISDYARGVARFSDVADYIAINISSPNTPGLRDLQEAKDLARLLGAATEARDAAPRRVPLLVKIAPDLDDDALAAIVATVRDAGIEGLIVSNTTVTRHAVAGHRHAGEAGGLSGRPLFAASTAMLGKVRALAGPAMVLVGVGGVDSPETAFAKVLAGADLVQVYTGLIYRGPTLPGQILAALPRLLARRGFASLADAVGADPEAYRALAG